MKSLGVVCFRHGWAKEFKGCSQEVIFPKFLLCWLQPQSGFLPVVAPQFQGIIFIYSSAVERNLSLKIADEGPRLILPGLTLVPWPRHSIIRLACA